MKSPEKNKWDKPEGEPLFIAISKDDSDYAAAYVRSRETFPHFLSAIRSPAYATAINAVKLRLKDEQQTEELGEDRHVFLWLYGVKEELPEFYSAQIIELPKSPINDLAEGMRLRFRAQDIYDWMIVRSGHLWGGLTIRLVRERQSEEQKANFDEYSGFSVYEPNLP